MDKLLGIFDNGQIQGLIYAEDFERFIDKNSRASTYLGQFYQTPNYVSFDPPYAEWTNYSGY